MSVFPSVEFGANHGVVGVKSAVSPIAWMAQIRALPAVRGPPDAVAASAVRRVDAFRSGQGHGVSR